MFFCLSFIFSVDNPKVEPPKLHHDRKHRVQIKNDEALEPKGKGK